MKRQRRVLLAAAAAAVASIGVSSGIRAASISESANPPGSNILAKQLSSMSFDNLPGTNSSQDSNGDYTDNAGPVGETFMIPGKSIVTAVTILGNGDDQLDPGQFFHIEIGRVDPSTGQITQLGTPETVPQTAVTSDHDYVTFNLDNPLTLDGGTTQYEFSIYTDTAPNSGGDWYGLVHSAPGTHPDNGGTAFNYDKTTTNTDDNMNGIGKNNGWPTPGFVAPNVHDYEYVFAVQGTAVAVPEPAMVGSLGLSVLSLLLRRRKRA